MKNIFLITITILSSISTFASEKVLLICSDKFNALTVTADDQSGSIEMTREFGNRRQLMYVDRVDQSEQSPVVVNNFENNSQTAMLNTAKASVDQSKINITFSDKKSTQLTVAVINTKENVSVGITSANADLSKAVLKSLGVNDEYDLSFDHCELGK